MSLIIHAPNVHQGGGRALLLALLGSLKEGSVRQVILDARLRLDRDLPQDVRVERVLPTIAGRLIAEWRLRRLACASDTVLCFGNLPPLFPVCARVIVYIQNRYHVNRDEAGSFPAAVRLRLWFEHRLFDLGRSRVDKFIVQTPSMQRGVEQQLGIHAQVLPFVKNAGSYVRRAKPDRSPKIRKYDFLYVASGEPHKNHARLVEAWCILAEKGYRPTLCLTLSPETTPELCQWIEKRKHELALQIEIVGVVGDNDLADLYQAAGALIYPSMFESFGLPLIEARQAGLSIVAAELDYVRDVVDPEESFDPHSAFSIARAVLRLMGKTENELGILDAATFLHRVMDRT